MNAEELLKAGRIDECLEQLKADVRSRPSDAKLRVFLAQVQCVVGQWDKALTQLKVAAGLDPACLLMAQACSVALNCEALRADIFAGERTPLVLGEPHQWLGLLIQANKLAVDGEYRASQDLRSQAFDGSPAIAGTINDDAFEWIADADPRLGPVLEVIVEGRYYWAPFQHIREVRFEPPQDLRDVVWLPAHFVWRNGGTAVGLIPARYPGTEAAADPALRMARKTEWTESGEGLFTGLGQRMLATDGGEYPLLEVRDIRLNHPGAPEEEARPDEQPAPVEPVPDQPGAEETHA